MPSGELRFAAPAAAVVALLSFAVQPLHAQGVVTTIAGTDFMFPSGPIPALNAPLGKVNGVAFDRDGNLFISDISNFRILEVNREGQLSVIGGNGLGWPISGDTGPATSTALVAMAIAPDPAGGVYLATASGTWGGAIRRITPNGLVSTVCSFTSFSIDHFVLNTAGTFYLSGHEWVPLGTGAYRGEFRVWKTLADGKPSILVRDTDIEGIALDAAGNLYGADLYGNRVVRIAPDGTLTPFAGDGTCGGASGDGGPATRASLCRPQALAFDAQGNLYIGTDAQVRKVDRQGIVTTVAGTGTADFSGDGGPAIAAGLASVGALAFSPAGELHIADTASYRVRKVSANAVISTVAGNGMFHYSGDNGPAATAALNQPLGITIDSGGGIVFADEANHRVRRVAPDGTIATIAGTGVRASELRTGVARQTPLADPQGVAADARGNVYISDVFAVRRLSPDGMLSTLANANGVQQGLAAGPGGDVYIAERWYQRIRKIAANGTISLVAGTGTKGYTGDGGPATQATLNDPRSIVLDATGVVYFADTGNNVIRKIGLDGQISTIAGDGTSGFAPDGSPATKLFGPIALALALDGGFYIADWGNTRIRRISPSGIITTIGSNGKIGYAGDGGPAAEASFSMPNALVADANGNLLISDTGNNRIRMITAAPPSFTVSPESLTFQAPAGGISPASRTISVSGSVPAIAFTATGDQPWISVSPAAGGMPAVLQVSIDTANLAPGGYTGAVTITASSATPATRQVSITLTVSQAEPPHLELRDKSLTLTAAAGGTPASKQISVLNAGAGTLSFTSTATAAGGAGWLQLSASSGTATPTAPASLTVTANPTGLAAGTYSGAVVIAAGSDTVTIPVTFTITAPAAKILISQTGLAYVAVSRGGSPSPQSIGVLNEGAGTMSWTARATTLAGGDWLSIAPANGSVERPFLDVSMVDVRVNSQGLAAGDYFGQIWISAAAINSPQVVTVVLRVLPEGANPGPEIRPTGLIFAAPVGSSPASQDVRVTNLVGKPLTYVSSRLTTDGQPWFQHLPTDATVAPNDPVRVIVQPDYSNMSAGVRRGVLTLLFDDGNIRTVSLLTVVAPSAASGSSADGRRYAASCKSPNLRVEFTAVSEGFSASIGQPMTIEAKIVDECGKPLVNDTAAAATVVARFSNKDPDLRLVHIGSGVWTGTWKPTNPTQGPVMIAVTGLLIEGSTRQAGQAQRTGSIVSQSKAPLVTPGSVVHAATYASNAPLAPGGLISVFGANLADQEAGATSLPLPEELQGTEVLLGGTALPLLYSNAGQINAQIPFTLPVNTQHQVVVRRGTQVSVPEQLTVAAAQPGIFTKNQQGFGQGVIFKADGVTLAQPATPAGLGEVIVIYCAGLGAVNPPVEQGKAAPFSPLAKTVNEVTVTVGGKNAVVQFNGLTPGFAGLYQVNAVVPGDVPAGDEVPVVLTVAGQTSNAATIAVR